MSKIPGMFSLDANREVVDEDQNDPIQGLPSYLNGVSDAGFGLQGGVRQFRASGAMVSPSLRTDKPEIATEPVSHNKPLFNDIHCHMADYSGRMHHLRDVIDAANANGIGRWTMMPIPTMVVSKMGDQLRLKQYDKAHHCGETYYIPEDWNCKGDSLELDRDALIAISLLHELRVDGDVDTNLLTEVTRAVIDKKITPAEMNRMDLGMTGLHLGDPSVTKTILKKLRTMMTLNEGLRSSADKGEIQLEGNRLRYSLIGEVTLRKELVEELFAGESQAHLEDNITPTREAMRLAGEIGLPWLLHCDIDHMKSTKDELAKSSLSSSGLEADTPRHLKSIKKLFRACPNTDIIWAHAGGLGRFVKAGSKHTQHLEDIFRDETLSHVKIDISWNHVAKQLVGKSKNSTDDREATCKNWAEFLCKYSDRIIFGSDTLTPKNNAAWMETFNEYSPSLFKAVKELDFKKMQENGQLPEGVTTADDLKNEDSETLSKILFTNYANLMDKSRKRMDFFTDHVLGEVVPSASYIGGSDTVDVQAIASKRIEILNSEILGLHQQIEDCKDDEQGKEALKERLAEFKNLAQLFRVTEENYSSAVSNASEKSFGTHKAVDANLLADAYAKKMLSLNDKIKKGIDSLEKQRNSLEQNCAALKKIPIASRTEKDARKTGRNERLIYQLNGAIEQLRNLLGSPKAKRRASIG